MPLREARSPTTTCAATGSAARASSARASLRPCRVTSCPSRASSSPAIRPRPSDEPVISTRAMRVPLRGLGVWESCGSGGLAGRSAGSAGVPMVLCLHAPRRSLPKVALWLRRYDVQAMSSAPATASSTGQTDGGTAAVIRTEELTKVYPGTDFAAVDGLNLSVDAGEIFGLLGPNGAGKTTTAGILTTRVLPTSGRAFLAGVDVAAHPALAKQLSGIVSQQNTLDRQLTVWENLYFHGRLFGIGAKASRRIADELLEQFQLSRWAKASVYALSGGMAQRLMVARAIFHRPSVLFLDEPTAGLDPQ